jgi:two-component system, LytTR family, response regulator
MAIRTLIVDDEPLARLNLATLLDEEDDFELVGECADAASGAQAVARLAPQLVFLDVQMPGADGFALLDAVTASTQAQASPMAIVFVTAHAQFAVQAFEARALDYLLKPFRRDRFEATLDRVRQHLGTTQALQPAAAQPGASALAIEPDRLVARSGHRLVFVDFDELELVRAAANYVTLHYGPQHETLDVRERIGVLAQRLPAARFLRIHRSYIVNLAQLRALYPVGGGEYMASLRSGRQLPVGPSYPMAIRRALEQARVPRIGGAGPM